MSNRVAVETLGMPQGTAANRLRKMVLFRQLRKYGDNACVRCGKEIATVDELSIEHIEPWEGRSAELFWDLDNIAFSHMKCNVPHIRRGGTPRRIEAPSGFSWCSRHQAFLPTDNFSSKATRWNGLKEDCKECEKNYKDSVRHGAVRSPSRQ